MFLDGSPINPVLISSEKRDPHSSGYFDARSSNNAPITMIEEEGDIPEDI